MEVIVVDNNSTDGTFPLLSEYAPRLPLKILRHKVPGKSGAMNRALAEASGKILVFTDDDIRADPRWLEAISDCADRHPDYGLFGGCILPDWETRPTADFIKWIPMDQPLLSLNPTKVSHAMQLRFGGLTRLLGALFLATFVIARTSDRRQVQYSRWEKTRTSLCA